MKSSKKVWKIILISAIGLSSITLTIFSIKYAELFGSDLAVSSKKLKQPLLSEKELLGVIDINNNFNSTKFKSWFLKKLNLKITELDVYFAKKQIAVCFKFKKNKYNWYYKL
ncbi:hypothetical protein CXP39_00845 [Mesoplasma syrphidae]|uniref:Uncharacterized protein n=1 Tax=Mesoplasma syrphidae TaxID=225999 RepID=A0A2K9C8L3_9MOLU|nr:hypothetical protein [Mesoplasma syrphidae]AUF83355.1 hypothetical protein CXP39_00845 [Mesoplasma syrphidae]